MNRERALRGSTAPASLLAQLTLIDVEFLDLTGTTRSGQLVVHEELETEISSIFVAVRRLGLPIAQMVPISAYDWDDDASMSANNTSCFNYRLIAGTDRPSMHSLGAAIDINPAFNPYGHTVQDWVPIGASYDLTRPGTIADDPACALGYAVIQLFARFGWTWLGTWPVTPDRHHFEKTGFRGQSTAG